MSSTQVIMTSALYHKDADPTTRRPCKLKLAILGDKHVGKTSLLTRFVRGSFNPNYIHTEGGDISHKNVCINGMDVHLTLVDSAGHKYVRSLIKTLYRNAHGIMLVYDITRLHTFESMDEWLKQVKLVNVDNPFIMVVGNKVDLEYHDKIVPSIQAEQYAEQRDLAWMQVSAKTGVNVQQAFNYLITHTFRDKMPVGSFMTSIVLGKADDRENDDKDNASATCSSC